MKKWLSFLLLLVLAAFFAWPSVKITLMTKALKKYTSSNLGYKLTFDSARTTESGHIVMHGVRIQPIQPAILTIGLLTAPRATFDMKFDLNSNTLISRLDIEDAHVTLTHNEVVDAHWLKRRIGRKKFLFHPELNCHIQGTLDQNIPFQLEAHFSHSLEGLLKIADHTSLKLTTEDNTFHWLLKMQDAPLDPLAHFYKPLQEYTLAGFASGELKDGKGSFTFNDVQVDWHNSTLKTPECLFTIDQQSTLQWKHATLKTPDLFFEKLQGELSWDSVSSYGSMTASSSDKKMLLQFEKKEELFQEGSFFALEGRDLHGRIELTGKDSFPFQVTGDHPFFKSFEAQGHLQKGTEGLIFRGQFFSKNNPALHFDLDTAWNLRPRLFSFFTKDWTIDTEIESPIKGDDLLSLRLTADLFGQLNDEEILVAVNARDVILKHPFFTLSTTLPTELSLSITSDLKAKLLEWQIEQADLVLHPLDLAIREFKTALSLSNGQLKLDLAEGRVGDNSFLLDCSLEQLSKNHSLIEITPYALGGSLKNLTNLGFDGKINSFGDESVLKINSTPEGYDIEGVLTGELTEGALPYLEKIHTFFRLDAKKKQCSFDNLTAHIKGDLDSLQVTADYLEISPSHARFDISVGDAGRDQIRMSGHFKNSILTLNPMHSHLGSSVIENFTATLDDHFKIETLNFTIPSTHADDWKLLSPLLSSSIYDLLKTVSFHGNDLTVNFSNQRLQLTCQDSYLNDYPMGNLFLKTHVEKNGYKIEKLEWNEAELGADVRLLEEEISIDFLGIKYKDISLMSLDAKVYPKQKEAIIDLQLFEIDLAHLFKGFQGKIIADSGQAKLYFHPQKIDYSFHADALLKNLSPLLKDHSKIHLDYENDLFTLTKNDEKISLSKEGDLLKIFHPHGNFQCRLKDFSVVGDELQIKKIEGAELMLPKELFSEGKREIVIENFQGKIHDPKTWSLKGTLQVESNSSSSPIHKIGHGTVAFSLKNGIIKPTHFDQVYDASKILKFDLLDDSSFFSARDQYTLRLKVSPVGLKPFNLTLAHEPTESVE